MNQNRPEKSLLLVKRNTDNLIKQLETRPKETLEIKLNEST